MNPEDFEELSPEVLAALYVKRHMIADLLNNLHNTQLDYLDEAVLKSNMDEANAFIKHIMEKK